MQLTQGYAAYKWEKYNFNLSVVANCRPFVILLDYLFGENGKNITLKTNSQETPVVIYSETLMPINLEWSQAQFR